MVVVWDRWKVILLVAGIKTRREKFSGVAFECRDWMGEEVIS